MDGVVGEVDSVPIVFLTHNNKLRKGERICSIL